MGVGQFKAKFDKTTFSLYISMVNKYLSFHCVILDVGPPVLRRGTIAGTAPEPKEPGYVVRLTILTRSAR